VKYYHIWIIFGGFIGLPASISLDPGNLIREAIVGKPIRFDIKCLNDGDKPAFDISLKAACEHDFFMGEKSKKIQRLNPSSFIYWRMGWQAPSDPVVKSCTINFTAEGSEKKIYFFTRQIPDTSTNVIVHILPDLLEESVKDFLNEHVKQNNREEAKRDIRFILQIYENNISKDAMEKTNDKVLEILEESFFSKKEKRGIIRDLVIEILGGVLSNPAFYLFLYNVTRYILHLAPPEIEEKKPVPPDVIKLPGEEARTSDVDGTLLFISNDIRYIIFEKAVKQLAQKMYDPQVDDDVGFLEGEIRDVVFYHLLDTAKQGIMDLVRSGRNFVIEVHTEEVYSIGQPINFQVIVYYAGGIGETGFSLEFKIPPDLSFDADAFNEDMKKEREERWSYPRVVASFESISRKMSISTMGLIPGDVIKLDLDLQVKNIGEYLIGPFELYARERLIETIEKKSIIVV